MVKMRLQRKGRKKAPFYHIVIADARSPRDGRFIERLGFYNPMTSPATIDIDREKALEWIAKGAQPTDTVRSILRFKGVLLRKHLLLGVKKGAISLDQADAKWKVWADAKEVKLTARREAVAKKNLLLMHPPMLLNKQDKTTKSCHLNLRRQLFLCDIITPNLIFQNNNFSIYTCFVLSLWR